MVFFLKKKPPITALKKSMCIPKLLYFQLRTLLKVQHNAAVLYFGLIYLVVTSESIKTIHSSGKQTCLTNLALPMYPSFRYCAPLPSSLLC